MEINIITVCSEPTVLDRVAVVSALALAVVVGVMLWRQFRRPDRGFWGSTIPYLVALVPAAFNLGMAWLQLAAAVRAVSLSGGGAIFAAASVGELVQSAILGVVLSVVLVIIVALVNLLLGRHSSVGGTIAGSRVPVAVVLVFGLISVLLVLFSLDLVGRAPATTSITIHLAMAGVCVMASLALLGSPLVASRVGRSRAGSSVVVAIALLLVLGAEGAFLSALSRQMYALAIGA